MPDHATLPSPAVGPMVRAVLLVLGVLSALGFDAVGHEYYAQFLVPQGFGMDHLLTAELAFHAYFLLFGLAALLALAYGLESAAFEEAARRLGRGAAAHGLFFGAAVGLGLFLACGAAASAVLGHAAITDDEHAYSFIAQTLRTGSLVAPSPGGDLPYFREQFVVVNDHYRYGKYPIGHPLLLAVGQALGVEPLVGPLLTALLVIPLWLVAVSLFDAATAALSVALLLLSPQIVLTGATRLSQPASGLCLVAGVALLLQAFRGARAEPWLLAAAGGALAYGVLVRPLPGVLFAGVGAAWVGLQPGPAARRASRLAAYGAPLLLAAALLAWTNAVQTGGALTSGYQEMHGTGEGPRGVLGLLGGGLAARSMSVASSVLRESSWLLGWPLAVLLCAFAPRRPGLSLVWGLVGAEMAYRVISPKAGVGSTGPLYLHEVVPLLSLLAAAALVRFARERRRPGVAALLVAGTLVSATMFVPVQLRILRRMARAQLALPSLLAERGVHHAVVFHDGAVPYSEGLTWAYYPRINGPGLDDDVLFLLAPRAAMPGAVELWRRRFPDRGAFAFRYQSDGRPALVPLAP